MDADTQIVSLEPHSIDDILSHVELVGRLTGAVRARGESCAMRVRASTALRAATAERPRPRVACIEWLDPIFAAGHWVPEQVEWAGGAEVLGPRGVPSPEVPWQAVLDAQPEVVILMPCGMPIDRTLGEFGTITSRDGWHDLPAVRDGRVFVVDASSFFNRPGPRVVRGAEVLGALLHPDLFTQPSLAEAVNV